MRALRLPLLVAALASAGCASMMRKVQTDAFAPARPLAVVTVYGPEQVRYLEHHVATGAFGAAEMRSSGFDAGEARRVFPKTKAAVLRALARTGHFRLLPEQQVLASSGYKAFQPSTGFIASQSVAAPGYKLVLEEEAVVQLAGAVGAEAGIIVRLEHYYTTQGVPGGRIAGDVMISIGAIDRAGRTIWFDWTKERSDKTLPSDSVKVDLSVLEPVLVDSVEKGVRVLVDRLHEKLAAR